MNVAHIHLKELHHLVVSIRMYDFFKLYLMLCIKITWINIYKCRVVCVSCTDCSVYNYLTEELWVYYIVVNGHTWAASLPPNCKSTAFHRWSSLVRFQLHFVAVFALLSTQLLTYLRCFLASVYFFTALFLCLYVICSETCVAVWPRLSCNSLKPWLCLCSFVIFQDDVLML